MNRQLFGAAIAALDKEAAELEHRAAATRALVQQLRDHAGGAAAVKRQNQDRISSGARRPEKRGKMLHSKSDPPKGRWQAAKVDERKKLEKLVAEVARLDGLIRAAKDAAAIERYVAAMLDAERRGGEILIALGGKVKVPVGRLLRQRWRDIAALTPERLATRLEWRLKSAIAAIDGSQPKRPSVAPAVPNPPSAEPAPSKPPSVEPAPPKRSYIGPPPPVKKLTAWHQDETGALSRELSST